jgi:cyclophilin family peptidyl-prolyl cis-trans isomerase/HEAT repeat protein
MRPVIVSSLILVMACTSTPPPKPAPPPPPPATQGPFGISTEDEARLLALEDRRDFDAAMAQQWLANPNSLHRQRMALALGRIGPLTFVDANGNGERDANEHQAGVDLLAKLVTDADRTVRETAAFALGEIGDMAGADALLQFANDADAGVAAEAVEALSKLAPKLPLARYAPFADASRPEGVRVRAVRFLFRFASDEASALAASAVDSNDAPTREAGTYALARRAYAPARDRLHLLLTDANVQTRVYAASALGRIGAKESIEPLMHALRDGHPWVRTNALVAIARIATKDANSIARGDSFAQDVLNIIALTDDPDPGTRASSIDTLGWYASKSETAKKRLNEIMTGGSRWDRELAVGAWAKQFGDAPAQTSWEKVRVLDSHYKRELASDPDPMVRSSALGAIPDKEVDAEEAVIVKALADPDVIVRANAIDKYAKLKSRDVAVLAGAEQKARGDAMNDARLSAISSLAEIDYKDRESFLRSLLADRDPVVRHVAADMIEEKLKKNRPRYTPLPVDRPAAEYVEIVRWSKSLHNATIHMTRGAIEIQLLSQDAPLTTWNFVQLAKKRFFDNTSFMRVVPNFVIQGGDPRNDMSGGPGYSIRDEINLQKYTRAAVGMALSGPDTGGSQFFITHSAQPHLDGGYTIFARVSEGMSAVVDQTERGDRVDTIAIDEHKPAAASDLLGPQKTPLPTEIGRTSAARLMSIVPEYEQRKASYQPDASELQFMASQITPRDRVEIYLGTWCSDSQREVPKFLRIVDDLKAKYGAELPVSFVAVDRAKQKPVDLLSGKSIEKVATFIVYRGDHELGRIVEKPQGLLEDDLLALLAPVH